MKSKKILSCEISSGQIIVAEIVIKKKRAKIVASKTDVIAAGESPVKKIASMALAMKAKGGRLFISDSSLCPDHRIYAVPPMSRSAEKNYLLSKVAGEIGVDPGDVALAYQENTEKKAKMPRQVAVLIAQKRTVDSYMKLEGEGFIIECLTTPEMAIYSMARHAGLLKGQERYLVYSSGYRTYMVAAGSKGPVFARSFDGAQTSEGFAFGLSEELRHANIYLQQKQRKQMSSLIMIDTDLSSPLNLPEIDITSFNGDELLIDGATENSVIASLPLAAMNKHAVNLLESMKTSRSIAGVLIKATLIVGLLVSFSIFKSALSLDTQTLQYSSRLQSLESRVASFKPIPEEDYRVTEKKAIASLLEQVDLKMPDWPGLLKEIALVAPTEIEFDSLEVTRIDKEDSKSGSRRRRKKRGGKTDIDRTGWVLHLKGMVSGSDYQHVQSIFRSWHENMSASPYLFKVNVENINMAAGHISAGKTGKKEKTLKFSLIANVTTSIEMENVIKKIKK